MNPHVLTDTSTSSWRVCQIPPQAHDFQHKACSHLSTAGRATFYEVHASSRGDYRTRTCTTATNRPSRFQGGVPLLWEPPWRIGQDLNLHEAKHQKPFQDVAVRPTRLTYPVCPRTRPGTRHHLQGRTLRSAEETGIEPARAFAQSAFEADAAATRRLDLPEWASLRTSATPLVSCRNQDQHRTPDGTRTRNLHRERVAG